MPLCLQLSWLKSQVALSLNTLYFDACLVYTLLAAIVATLVFVVQEGCSFTCASMWTVKDIEAELKDVSQLLQLRAQSDHAKLEASLLAGVTSKIEHLKQLPTWGPGMAVSLYTCLDTLAFSVAFKDKVKTFIDDALGSGATAKSETMSMLVLKTQTVNVMPWLTEADWDILNSNQGYSTKLNCMCARLRAIGIRSMSEQTAKYAVACLCCLYTEMPDATTTYRAVQDMKMTFNSMSQPPAEFPYIREYPMDPASLSPEYISLFYKDEQPAGRHLDKLAQVLPRVCVRSTSKLLRDAAVKPSPKPCNQNVPVITDQGDSMKHMFQHAMTSMFANMFNSQLQRTHATGNRDMPDLKMLSPRKQLAIAAGKDAEDDEHGAPPVAHAAPALPTHQTEAFKPKVRVTFADQQQPKDQTIDIAMEDSATTRPFNDQSSGSQGSQGEGASRFEEQAFNLLKERADNKKGVIKAILKRPAASSPPPPKPTLPEYEPGKDCKGTSLKNWTSKHYHKAKLLAKKQEASAEEVLEYARKASKKASIVWNEING